MPHGLLALQDNPPPAVVAVAEGGQLSHQLAVDGDNNLAGGELFPQPPVSLGPQIGEKVVLPGGAGHVDGPDAVALLPQSVHYTRTHTYLVDVDLVRLGVPNAGYHPTHQLHGVHAVKGPNILHPMALAA